MRVALGIPPIGLPMDFCTEVVRRAEERGFEAISVGEAWGVETCTMVGALLARSQRIHISTGIVSIYLRPPTLDRHASGDLGFDCSRTGASRLGGEYAEHQRLSWGAVGSPGVSHS